jgi:hypothetical protein
MFILIDPTHEKITETLEQAKLKVSILSAKGPVNLFNYYSGHGTSLAGKLHITTPTVFTQDDYVS